MSNTDWFNYGGLYRDVALVRVPDTFISNYDVALEGDGGISVSVQVDASGGVLPASPADAAGVGAAEAMDSAGIATSVPVAAPESVHLRIDELDISVDIPLKPASSDPETAKIAAKFGDGGRAEAARALFYGTISLKADPERWSPENPKLYDVELHCGADSIFEPIGFRTIEREGRRILLNGEPVFFRGVSMHEDDPRSGKTYAEAEIRRDFEVALDLGCNFVRLAHYPHSRMAAQIADEMGLMLWEEIPVYWAIDFANPATQADAENQLSELILRDRNRASVVVWSVGNENPDSDERLAFMSGLVNIARGLDPTRLVSAACLTDHAENRIADRLAEHLDLIGINEYFGWYDPEYEKLPAMLANSDPDRPVVITEFGGGALVGHRGSTDEFFTEDRQRAIYERQIDEIVKCPYIKGISPWILFDFRCPRRANRFQRFYNRKGLVADDHETRKLAFETLQEFYAGEETDTLAEQA
jgi:beta-glucuronidase